MLRREAVELRRQRTHLTSHLILLCLNRTLHRITAHLGVFELANPVLHLLLRFGKPTLLLLRRFDVAPRLAAPLLLEQAPRFVEPVYRAPRVGRALPSVGRRLPHLVGRVLEPARRIGEWLRLPFTREPFELSRRLFRFLRQLPPIVAAGSAALAHLTEAVGFALRPHVLLHLARRELPQFLSGFVERRRCGILLALLGGLATLHGLVLIAQPVLLQLKDVGEILSIGATATTAAASTATALLLLLNLYLAEHRLGASEFGERLLLTGQR